MYMHSDNVLLVLLLYLSHICIINSHETSIHGGLVQVTDRTGTALQGLMYLLGHVTAARQDWPVSLRNDVL